MSSQKLISIIIPSYNQAKYIGQTLDSILDQPYPNKEIIVIDGGSTDNTVDILSRYNEKIYWISEKDNGQADALNKGFKIAKGEIIGWLNSDDLYEPEILTQVAEEFNDSNTQWLVSNIKVWYEKENIKENIITPQISYKALLGDPDIVKQQGAFYRKNLIEKAGGWGSKFYMVMDYDLWLRLAKISQPKMIPKTWATFRIHSEQKTSSKNLVRQLREIDSILEREQISWFKRKIIFRKKYFYVAKYIFKSLLISSGMINKKYETLPLRLKENSGSSER